MLFYTHWIRSDLSTKGVPIQNSVAPQCSALNLPSKDSHSFDLCDIHPTPVCMHTANWIGIAF